MSVLHGFEQTRQRRIDELDAVLHEYIHTASGARLCWLEREDENKSFCAAFRTLPFDDTGVFHILEHSVLCGSKHFPVKEPFVELMKGSLNTFLNALTFPDKTCYPVASRNSRDFLNLMRVYLDAVFFPSIHEKPEIFQQEGWHYELHDGVLTRSGVVLNEMKGAVADADELLINAMSRALFPASPYRFISGGDPEALQAGPSLMFITIPKVFDSMGLGTAVGIGGSIIQPILICCSTAASIRTKASPCWMNICRSSQPSTQTRRSMRRCLSGRSAGRSNIRSRPENRRSSAGSLAAAMCSGHIRIRRRFLPRRC